MYTQQQYNYKTWNYYSNDLANQCNHRKTLLLVVLFHSNAFISKGLYQQIFFPCSSYLPQNSELFKSLQVCAMHNLNRKLNLLVLTLCFTLNNFLNTFFELITKNKINILSVFKIRKLTPNNLLVL